MKRTFIIDYSIFGEDVSGAIIELDQQVIDAVDDDWRANIYPLHTPEDIARHICDNMVRNRLQLSQLDGWADMDNSLAKMLEWPDLDQWDLEAREVKR